MPEPAAAAAPVCLSAVAKPGCSPSDSTSATPGMDCSVAEALGALPDVFPLPVPCRVPRRARKRLARIMVNSLAHLLDVMPWEADRPCQQTREAALVCLKACSLVLWREDEAEGSAKTNREAKQWKVLRGRLQLAEAGRWQELAAMATAEIDRRAQRAAEAGMVCGGEVDPARHQERRRQQAIHKVELDCTRTAAQLLRGQQILPPGHAVAEAQMAQLVRESREEDDQALRRHMDMATISGAAVAPRVLEKDVAKRLDKLRVGAQPGGMATRNDVLQAMGEVKGGRALLTRWAQWWASGWIPQSVARLFGGQTLRPIKKPNGKPRNISLMECLLKLASGVTQDAIRREGPTLQDHNAEGLHWSQYGGQAAGPELMLMVHQGMMQMRPGLAYCSLDAENAYGTIKRAAMLEGTLRWCPKHAPFLAAQWRAESTAWVETGPGKWEKLAIKEGTAQGDTASTPAFSRGLRVALEQARERLAERGVWLHLPSLVDDMLLVCDPENVDECIDVLESCLARIGLKLNQAKCAAYVPAWRQASSDGDQVIRSIPVVHGGLPALGSAYAGEFEAVVSENKVKTAPAERRLEEALRLAAECAKFAHDSSPNAVRHCAWHVLQRVVAKALVYDVRVLDPNDALRLARRLDSEVRSVARELLGAGAAEGWDEVTDKQLQWQQGLGGMDLGSAELSARIGRIACMAQCLPVARKHLAAVFPEASEEEILAAVSVDSVEEQLAWLREEWGVEVGVGGAVAKEKEPRWNPRARFEPMAGLTSMLTKEVQEREAAHVRACTEAALERENLFASAHRQGSAEAVAHEQQAAAHERRLIRMRSCSGDGCHEWVRHPPTSSALRFTDSEFVFAARWRLGLKVRAEGECHHRSAKEAKQGAQGQRCGKLADPWGDHCILCVKGKGRYRSHGAVCRCLQKQARCAGLEADEEEVCAELLQGTPGAEDAVEARLDLHVWGHGEIVREEWIDVTITHPAKQSGRPAARKDDGAAVLVAEGKKLKRYGQGSGGVSCSPFGVETWGRFGPSALEVLERIADQHALHRGACRWRTRARWAAELGVALMRALAETVAQSTRAKGEATDDDERGGAQCQHVQGRRTGLAAPNACDEQDLTLAGEPGEA